MMSSWRKVSRWRMGLGLLMAAAVVLMQACGGSGGHASEPSAAAKSVPAPCVLQGLPSIAVTDPAPATPASVWSISASPRLEPWPGSVADYMCVALEAFTLGYQAGARGQMNTWTWRELEPSKAAGFDAQKWSDVDGALTQARKHGMAQFVGIQVINTSAREMPSDLSGLAFDHELVKQRFHALLDKLITPNKGRIKYLSIGNEVDAYLRAHPDQWQAYRRFYEDAARHAKSLDPALLLGVTATADGALSESTSEVRALNAVSDVVVLTYYPITFGANGVVGVREPTVAASDFQRMLGFAGTRPLVLQEIGYPASALTGGTQAMQAAFFQEAFKAWRQFASQVPFMNVFLLHDFPEKMCDELAAYYQIAGNESFKAFLCSLGLREADGTPRQAWRTLLDEGARLPQP